MKVVDIISDVNKLALKIKSINKSQLKKLYIRVSSLVLGLIITYILANIALDMPVISLLKHQLFELLLVTLEITLIINLIYFLKNQVVMEQLQIRYGLLIAIVIEISLNLYNLTTIIDIKISLSTLAYNVTSLTVINKLITTQVIILLIELGIICYLLYNEYIRRGKNKINH